MSLATVTSAVAEQSVNDRSAWLEETATIIKAGRIDDLEKKIKVTLGSNMHEDVARLITPLSKVMAGHKAIYVDKISRSQLGQSFDQHVYAAYYSKRDFVFYSFTFARLEKGWQLYALDYADNLNDLDQPTK